MAAAGAAGGAVRSPGLPIHWPGQWAKAKTRKARICPWAWVEGAGWGQRACTGLESTAGGMSLCPGCEHTASPVCQLWPQVARPSVPVDMPTSPPRASTHPPSAPCRTLPGRLWNPTGSASQLCPGSLRFWTCPASLCQGDTIGYTCATYCSTCRRACCCCPAACCNNNYNYPASLASTRPGQGVVGHQPALRDFHPAGHHPPTTKTPGDLGSSMGGNPNWGEKNGG